MLRQLRPAIVSVLVITILTGLIFPAVITGIAQVAFHKQANGSLIEKDGKVIGSELIGQDFQKPYYFHPRTSAAGSGYDATSSSGSNFGPTSAKLIRGTTKTDDKKNEVVDYDGISLRIVHYCVENEIPFDTSIPTSQLKDSKGDFDDVKLIKGFNDDKAPLKVTPKMQIPADAVTASASGLDPHISPANAQLQAVHVARERKLSKEQVLKLIEDNTEGRQLGFLGEPRVNVLLLNLALDKLSPPPAAPPTPAAPTGAAPPAGGSAPATAGATTPATTSGSSAPSSAGAAASAGTPGSSGTAAPGAANSPEAASGK